MSYGLDWVPFFPVMLTFGSKCFTVVYADHTHASVELQVYQLHKLFSFFQNSIFYFDNF